jgi:hypothetical protein
MNKTAFTGAALSVLLLAGMANAAEYGTSAEAKAMLERAVVAVKADKSAAGRTVSLPPIPRWPVRA